MSMSVSVSVSVSVRSWNPAGQCLSRRAWTTKMGSVSVNGKKDGQGTRSPSGALLSRGVGGEGRDDPLKGRSGRWLSFRNKALLGVRQTRPQDASMFLVAWSLDTRTWRVP